MGDIVFMRRFNDHQGDWVLAHDFPFIVIRSGEISLVMGGYDGQTHTVPSVMLVDEEEKRMLKLCPSSEER